MKTRITALALALLMAVPTVSCGGEAGTTTDTTAAPDTTTAAVTTELTDGLPEKDMKGFTLSILHHNDEWMTWCVKELDVETMNGELVNDEIYLRNERIKERFNCNINIGTVGKVGEEISKLVFAGDTAYDVMMPVDNNLASAVPYLMDWNELPYLNLDADWWYPEANDTFRFGDKLYAAANSISLVVFARLSGFAFNKTVYDEMNMGKSIYDYVYEDNWNLDTFAMLARTAYRDVNGDGSLDENDRYGIGESSWKEVFIRIINGSQVNFVERGKDGLPEFKLDTDENSIDKLLKIYELAQDKQIYNNNESSMDSAKAYGDIKKGTALFRLCHPYAMGTVLREANIDYGFLPNPKYDENQEEYSSISWSFEVMTLPKTLAPDRYENIGMLLEALSFDGHTGVVQTYKEDAVPTKYAQDDDSLAMLDIAFDTISFDLGVNIWEWQIVYKLVEQIFVSGNGNVVSTLASFKPTILTHIDTLKEALAE